MEKIRIPRVIQDSIVREKMRGRTVGFVPTMGALHQGHMHLMRIARDENDIVVASIFVNPTQFGPGEDFENYPRDLSEDIEKLRTAGVDMLYLPEPATMYPEGYSTTVTVGGVSNKLCGRFRPGHFAGVSTVVTKLLNIVQPTRAYFGQKDYQQSLIIRRLVRDLNIPTEVVVCATIREEDGLAMSSRNAYLSAQERSAAASIHKSLTMAEERIRAGEKDAAVIDNLIQGVLKQESLITEIQYAGAYDPETLDVPKTLNRRTLLAVAVKLGKTRLIDNLLVE